MNERIERQLAFLVELDRLKGVLRHSRLMDDSRRENAAEHSWHVTVAAMLLVEHADEALDLSRVLKLLLLHDVVEIDAGDTFLYDETFEEKRECEARAAERIFELLPADQAREFRGLWEEFEARRTPEARFAAAVDRLLPVLHNSQHGGVLWHHRGVHESQVRHRNRHIENASKRLWAIVSARIADAFRS